MSQKASQLVSKLRFGCSGWGYEDWIGPFYPVGTPKEAFLKIYSHTFDTVEVDSAYYHTPQPATTAGWRRTVPDGFLFTAKFPKRITHELKLVNVEKPLDAVYHSMRELREKLGALVVQLPPSFKYDRHWEVMKGFVGQLDNEIRHAIEFRHPSWFRDDVYALLRERGISMAWSQNQYVNTPPVATSDFLYLRLVGERDIDKFSETVKDRSREMREWYKHLEDRSPEIKRAFVFFNNHYAGFGPGSLNEFRRLAGLMEIGLPAAGGPQRSIADFG